MPTSPHAAGGANSKLLHVPFMPFDSAQHALEIMASGAEGCVKVMLYPEGEGKVESLHVPSTPSTGGGAGRSPDVGFAGGVAPASPADVAAAARSPALLAATLD